MSDDATRDDDAVDPPVPADDWHAASAPPPDDPIADDGVTNDPMADDGAADEETDAGEPAEPYQAAGRVSPWGFVFFIGVFLLAAAGFWWYAESEKTVTLQVWAFVALVLTLSPLFWHAVEAGELLRSRRGRASGFVALTIALGVAVMVLVSTVNVAQRERLWSYDTTASGRFTLSEATRKLLDDVDGTLYVTYLQRQVATPGEVAVRQRAIEQIQVFGGESTDVKVRVFDAYRDNQIEIKEYLRSVGVEQLTPGEVGDVIVFSHAAPGREPTPGKQKELRVEPFTFVKQSSLGEEKWLGERQISEAIMELLFRRQKAYATGSHAERSLKGELRELRTALQSQNIELVDTPLDLRARQSVPEDCDVLMILDPQTAFAAEEAQAVEEFLDRGRMLLIAVDVNVGRRELGLEPLLERYGLSPRLNYLVLAPVETSRGLESTFRMMSQLPIQQQHYVDHPAVRGVRARGLGTVFIESTYVEVENEPPPGLSVEALIWAPFNAQIQKSMQPHAIRMETGRTSMVPVKGKDMMGQRLPIAAVAVRELSGEATATGQKREARIAYVCDTDFLTDRIVGMAPANLDLAVGLVQWGIRREGLIAVSERTIESQSVQPTAAERRRARAWPLFVTLLSLLVGGVVWWARRR